MDAGKIDLNNTFTLGLFNSLNEIHIALYVLCYSRDGFWSHNTVTRQRMARELDISEIAVKVILRELVSRTILLKKKKAQYSVNPTILTQ